MSETASMTNWDLEEAREKIQSVEINESAENKPYNIATNTNPRDGFPFWKWTLLLFGLYLGALLYGLDTTIAADVQGPVYETLGDIQNLPWVGLGFPMASVATILLFGRAYGLFNIKVLLLSSIFVFEVGSAICGAAPTSAVLIIGRVIAGIGGAGMYLGALTYISLFCSLKEAALYNALIGLSWGVGTILGPIVGGAFSVSHATWRWAFYINIPLAGLLSPVYFFIFPSLNPRLDLTNAQKLAEFDWIGAVLNGTVFVLFMIVVSFGGSTYAWDSGASIALWVIFGICFIAYVLQQSFAIFTTDEQRIFPVHFLKSRTLILLYTATGGAVAANMVTLYYIPLFFQFTRGDSALHAAVRLLPFICVFIFFIMLAGGSLPLVGRYNIYYIIGGSLIVIGGSLMFTINASTTVPHIYGYEVIIASGTGLIFQNAYAIAAEKVDPKDKPKAIGFINVAQLGTMALSLSIAGCLFQNLGFSSLKHAFAGYGFPDDYVRSALAGNLSPVFSSSDEQVIRIAVETIAGTIQRIFGTVIAGGAIVLVSALLMNFEKIELEGVAAG